MLHSTSGRIYCALKNSYSLIKTLIDFVTHYSHLRRSDVCQKDNIKEGQGIVILSRVLKSQCEIVNPSMSKVSFSI